MTDIRARAMDGLKVDNNFTVRRMFTEEDTIAFAEITRDYNPVHFDERFAAAKKFSSRICHGLLDTAESIHILTIYIICVNIFYQNQK